ncbi:A24 family peptidase [Erwinia sp. ErVv1]|uniref:prepilin peptidase n=1 Tax=Erwinia sp. ErVv1 TaxID=1603299 RepID=UPI00082A873F|nr:A24 family peptidase [Erwinia sp. ErVv1]
MDLFAEIARDLPVLWWAGLATVGLCVGSFLNMLIYRLPLMISIAEQRAEERIAPYAFATQLETRQERGVFNLLIPASHCTSCRTPLGWRNNIPLLSWLLIRGRSRCCNKPISISYPLVELVTVGVTLFCAWLFPPGLALVGVLLFSWLLLALAVIDGKTWLLPDALTWPLLWMGLLFNLNGQFAPLEDAVLGVIAGYGLLWLFNAVTSSLVKKNCMGNGDFKLTAALAAWSGWQCLPQLLLLAATLGILAIALAHLVYKKNLSSAIPFGPALAVAGWLQVTGVLTTG